MDFEKTFQTLRRYQIRINSAKCAFSISSRKFLNFIVSHRGIEANLENLQAILEMSPPRPRKEVQCLARWIVTLSRFIAWSGNKCLLLQSPETDKGLLLGGGVPYHLWGALYISSHHSTPDQASKGRNVSVPGHIPNYGKLGPCSGRCRCIEASVLHQVTEGCKDLLTEDGKGCLYSLDLILVALTLLLSILHHCFDWSALEVSSTKAGHLWKDHQVGFGVQRVQYPQSPITLLQSTGTCWHSHGIHIP